MSPEVMDLWMAGIHGAKTPLGLVFPAEKSSSSFLDSGTAPSSGRERQQDTWEEVQGHSHGTFMQGIIGRSHPLVLLKVKVKEMEGGWNLWTEVPWVAVPMY